MTELVVLPAEKLVELIEKAIVKARGADSGPLLLDRQQLAHKLGCSASQVDRLRQRGMPVLKVGEATVRFEPQAVLDWLRKHGDEPMEGQ